MDSGVYKLIFRDKIYIGCSGSIKTRVKQHLYRLNKNTHTNNLMQEAFAKYGEPIVEIIEYCEPSLIFIKEKEYIKFFDSFNNGLNKSKGGNCGSYNPTDEEKQVYINILFELAYTDKNSTIIGAELNVNPSIIRRISSKVSHTYLEEEYPIEYKLMADKLYSRPKNASKTAVELGKTYPKIVSPDGTVHEVLSVNGFSRDNNIGYSSLHKLLTGKIDKHKGWVRQ